jgi:hypothetical protein
MKGRALSRPHFLGRNGGRPSNAGKDFSAGHHFLCNVVPVFPLEESEHKSAL